VGPEASVLRMALASASWSAVKSCRTVARSLNWTTSARSWGRSVLVNRMAAAWATLSFSSMEAEVSIISASEMGRFSCVKRLSSWRMPSSKTAKSFSTRSVT